MKNLEKLSQKEQENFLNSLTINNIIKAGLVSSFPHLLRILGFNFEVSKKILEAIHQEMGIAKKYPFYSPISLETIASSSLDCTSIGDIIRSQIWDKYKQVGREQAYLDNKLNTGLNNSFPFYYVFVSNDLDLLKALFAIHTKLFGQFNIPLLEHIIPENDERRKTHLVKGTQAYDLYCRLCGDTSKPETALEKYLKTYPLDAVIVVTPDVVNYGIPIQIHRRKSPSSIAQKFAYSEIAYLLNMAYLCFPRQKVPNTRMEKYITPTKIGSRDIMGLANIYQGFKMFPYHVEQSNLGSLLELRNQDTISNIGEMHWDMNFKNPQDIEQTLGISPAGIGRFEVHCMATIQDYLMVELLGPHSRANFKITRARELAEAHPIRQKRKKTEYAVNYIIQQVTGTFMRGINLPSYPGEYFLVNPNGLELPKISSLSRGRDESVFEGRFSLYNSFPWKGQN